MGCGFDRFGEFESAHAVHPLVGQDELDVSVRQLLERLAAIRRFDALEAFASQRRADEAAHCHGIVHNQYGHCRVHRHASVARWPKTIRPRPEAHTPVLPAGIMCASRVGRQENISTLSGIGMAAWELKYVVPVNRCKLTT
jgi:hypothetical protein